MSLQLRHSCQETLDALGLNMLHVEVRDKTLTIVGECGQTVVTVNGIQCSLSITTKEIAIAVELFDKFLYKYGKDLVNYVTAKKASTGLLQPTYGKFTFKSEVNYSLNPNNLSYYLTLDSVSVHCNKPDFNTKKVKLTLNDLEYKLRKLTTLDKIKVLLSTLEAEQTELLKVFQELNDYFVAVNSVNTLKVKLSTCSI